jgi:TRAP transporter 4TM/12TM fusion protein
MRNFSGFWNVITRILAGIWSAFLVYTALTIALHPVLQGSICVSFGLLLVFLFYPLSDKKLEEKTSPLLTFLLFGNKSRPSLLDLLMAFLSLIPCIFLIIHWEEIVRFPGVYEPYHLVLGGILVICILEGTRRSLGVVIPLLVLLFVTYSLVGPWIPGMFGHAGFSFEELLYQFYLMTEGIWGLLTDLTSRLLALFVLFGPVLFATGVGKTFKDISFFTGGRFQGGAGHVAVISSSFFGMLSGSAPANVATTGSFTIPTMKRLGYRPELAGAIEASASSGGQIMPPIMGAGAFIMAEFLNIPYTRVMIAAIIPAVIYFVGIGAGVWVLAGKQNLGKLPLEEIPRARDIISPRQLITFLLPVGTLVIMLVLLLPPQYCAAWALIVAMGTYLLTGGRLSPKAIWERTKIIGRGYFSAVVGALAWLIVMMSCVQMAVCTISLTGFGVKISQLIISLAGVNISLALIATMVTALILGMGMTTTAAYVIAASVLSPALQSLGLSPLAGHLFIFYFAIISGITPPVCIAVFTGAAIAGSKWLSTAWIAMRLSIAAYIVPFIFAFKPEYLMQGKPLIILLHFLMGVVAMFPIAAGALGYFLKPTNLLDRLLFMIGGLAMLHPSILTDLFGLLLVAIGLRRQYGPGFLKSYRLGNH